MKAAFYYEPNVIKVDDLDIPEIGDSELLVRPRATSICGTDLRIFRHGHFKIPAGTKRVLGHEIAGEIVAVGRLIEGFSEGMRVTVPPNIGCGECEYCRDGHNNMCPNYEAFGISIDGGFQEYMRIPHIAIKGGNIFRLPDHISFEEGTLIEPLSCAYNCLRSVKTSHLDVVLVIGAGPVGAMHVRLNKVAGAKKVMVADIREDRLTAIRDYGADVSIDTSKVDLEAAVMDETGGRGADIIITAVSSPEIQTQAIGLLAIHGRVNFFGGLGRNVQVPIDTNRVHYKGLHLLGTTGSTHSDYSKSLSLVSEGRISLKSLISHTFTLEETPEAFEWASCGKGLKTTVLMTD